MYTFSRFRYNIIKLALVEHKHLLSGCTILRNSFKTDRQSIREWVYVLIVYLFNNVKHRWKTQKKGEGTCQHNIYKQYIQF